ncbi:hypothetical protein QVD17_25553 [Tagetes erecta]|uniref:SAM domain-containing protein n=1 Tax=Tagetes erecta TaxID=13708 RepID=A0AAD8KJ94_TARER|nr:hypothetical protein QVD17_25553 [Tagetes erecta]
MHQSIDWFSWLSKTGLEPSLIYEYGTLFSRNELEEEDITYFNHELLQSMGICIAKHRLEILKIARKPKESNGSNPVSKLLISIKKTKRSLTSYIRTWVHQDDSALVLVHKDYGSRWKGNMLKRDKRYATFKQPIPTLLLTNGNHKSNSFRVNSFSASFVYGRDQEKKGYGYGDDRFDHASFDEDGGSVEEIKWDTMFQDLKPT